MAFLIFVICAVFMSFGIVDCDYTSSSSGSHSSSDGTGGGYTQSNINGQQTFTSTNPQKPQTGAANSYVPGYYGPVNIADRFGGAPATAPTYSPAFPYNYNSYYNQPVYNPYPIQPVPSFAMPFVPYQPVVPSPVEFNNWLNSLQQQYYQYYKAQMDYLNAFKTAQSQASGSVYPNYAYATGAYGPNGIHQTAGINPPNQNSPNIDINNRFNPDENAINGGGFFGVSTSSFSSSSDIDGKKTQHQAAQTTVNDNGKVTTYKVSS